MRHVRILALLVMLSWSALLPTQVRAGLGSAVSGIALIDSRPPAIQLDPLGEHQLVQAGQTLAFHWTNYDDNPGTSLSSYWARVIVEDNPVSTCSWFPGPEQYAWNWTAPELQSSFCHLEVTARDAFGNLAVARSETFTLLLSTTDTPAAPPLLQVAQAAPNPFNPVCRLDFQLGRSGRVAVAVFNMRGQRVRDLLDRNLDAGPVSVRWNGQDDKGRPQPGGLYLFAVEIHSQGETRRELRKAMLLP